MKKQIELVDESDEEVPIVSVQRANSTHSCKATIPSSAVEFASIKVGTKLKIRKAKYEGEPALVFIPLKLA